MQGSISAGAPTAGAEKLAEVRGKNWATPDLMPGAVGIRRPIRVSFAADRLVLIPEKGTREELQVFRHGGRLATVIDPFVDAVRERMQSWGIAGQGIYWRPIVRAEVRQGAEDDFLEMVRLLEDSGIEVAKQP